MIRVISTDLHAIFFSPKINLIFSEKGDCQKWWRMMGCSVAMRFFRMRRASRGLSQSSATASVMAIAASG
jgi:hypothetical protein